jgi:hypothetical protein
MTITADDLSRFSADLDRLLSAGQRIGVADG